MPEKILVVKSDRIPVERVTYIPKTNQKERTKAMRKLATCLALALCSAMFVGCSNGPASVVEEQFNAVKAGDFDRSTLCLSAKMVKAQDARIRAAGGEDKVREQFKKLEPLLKDAKLEVLDTKIDGDTAMVKTKTICRGVTVETTIELVKENGSWKVNSDAKFN